MKTLQSYIKKVAGALVCCSMLMAAATLTGCSSDDDTPVLPAPDATGSFTDSRDGTEYGFVRYGQQEWMTENLRFQTTENPFLPDLKDPSPPRNPGSYYMDPNNAKYYKEFGALYNYEAAAEAVPEGWRLPTDEDWDKLAAIVSAENIRAAINLKFGGFMNPDERNMALYDLAYVYGYYWTSSKAEATENYAYFRRFSFKGGTPMREQMPKAYYLNVRCVRDAR